MSEVDSIACIWRLYHTLYVEVFGRVHSPLRDLVTKYIVVPEGSSLFKPQVRHFPRRFRGKEDLGRMRRENCMVRLVRARPCPSPLFSN
eukprot:COSAG04_NODE_3077_length_3191_cov_48.002264_4_plen_89_part_00